MNKNYQEIFTEIIKKAEESGWDLFCWKDRSGYLSWQVTGNKEDNLKLNILVKQSNRIVPIPFSVYDVVFNTKFAAHFFGTKYIEFDKNKGYEMAWKLHLPRISVLDTKLDYFKNLLN